MKDKVKLLTSMTVTQFDNGYWYATELKDFAKTIGIPFANRLRKDELEDCIKLFLKTGKIEYSNKRCFVTRSIKDVDLGLSLELPVAVYTNDKETKDFLEKEGQKIAPGLKRKSGARYRLNRWREEQLAKGVKITYARPGARICSTKSNQRGFRSDSSWSIHQLPKRFLEGREGCHSRTGDKGLGNAKDA